MKIKITITCIILVWTNILYCQTIDVSDYVPLNNESITMDVIGGTFTQNFHFYSSLDFHYMDYQIEITKRLRDAGIDWAVVSIYPLSGETGDEQPTMSVFYLRLNPFKENDTRTHRTIVLVGQRGTTVIRQNNFRIEHSKVVFTEIMYHSPLNEVTTQYPHTNGEYIEICNVGDQRVNLSGWSIKGKGTETVTFPDAENLYLNPQEAMLIAYKYKDSNFELSDLYVGLEYEPKYVSNVIYQDKIILDNSGMSLTLRNRLGLVKDSIRYEGNANKTMLNRLSADNANGIGGWECVSLHRIGDQYDETQNIFRCIFDRKDWVTANVRPLGISKPQASKMVTNAVGLYNFIKTTNYITKANFSLVVPFYMFEKFDMATENYIYFDGLGREVQSVDVNAGGDGNDIVQLTRYDNMGRNDTKKYLPFSYVNRGYFSLLSEDRQESYYNWEFRDDVDRNYAYASKSYSHTPTTDRIKQTLPGQNTYLHPHHTVFRGIETNEWIKKFVFAEDNKSLINTNTYETNALTAKDSWQEINSSGNNVVTTEYMDAEGRLVAKRVKESETNVKTTYHVYDNVGHERYIIPPTMELAVKGTYTLEQLSKHCFYNEYDKYGNIIVQYVPGMEPVFNIYDKRRRLVMTQSGNQRADGRNEWSYIKYDYLDRKVYSGVYNGGSLDEHRNAVTSSRNMINEKPKGSMHGYTSDSYPKDIDSHSVLTVNYYDSYDWLTDQSLSFSDSDRLSAYPSYDLHGLNTGSKIKVLGIEDNKWLINAVYYDRKYQPIQSVSQLYPDGIEIVSNAYSFTGAVTRTKVKQLINGDPHEYNKWFTYDSHGRTTQIEQQITGDNTNGKVRVVGYIYDDLSREIKKRLHNYNFTNNSNYRLNGQLQSSSNPFFSYTLGTDRPASPGLASRYDGNIGSVAWTRDYGIEERNGYSFDYDGSNQIKSAIFYKIGADATATKTDDFAEKDITYDENGNILYLHRTGQQIGEDQRIRYYYEDATKGNILTGITVNDGQKMAFKYDANGNLTEDMMSQIGIKYNVLNLPEKIFSKFTKTDTVRYIYNAAGSKLATVAPDGSLTYYRNMFIYAKQPGSPKEQLLSIIHSEGFATKESSGWGYKYLLKDHTGSTRAVIAYRGKSSYGLEQQTNYYPFGMTHGTLNNLHLNKYLYGGKEYQDAMINGSPLGLYDFHARYYNPFLGRWFNVDPVLQTTNPFLYCANNPILYGDPDGELFSFLTFIYDFFRTVLFKGGLDFSSGSSMRKAWKQFDPTSSSSMTNKAFQIDRGLFMTGGGQNFWQRAWELISRFTWQIHQTVLGYVISHGHNLAEGVKSVGHWGGATVLESYTENMGAFTLSKYIIGKRGISASPSNSLFLHEYGHYLQSRLTGPFYLPNIALPSLYSALWAKEHSTSWMEQDADYRSYKYFKNRFPGLYAKGSAFGSPGSILQNPIIGRNVFRQSMYLYLVY